MTTALGYQPYRPRNTRFVGVVQLDGFRLKHYAIVHGTGKFKPERFAAGVALAPDTLPRPAVTPVRPGVGLLITHQGNGADYVVVAWWDRENELPIRVIVNDGNGWRAATGTESVCVWDLEVFWHERQAYVATVLDPDAEEPLQAYLETVTGEG